VPSTWGGVEYLNRRGGWWRPCAVCQKGGGGTGGGGRTPADLVDECGKAGRVRLGGGVTGRVRNLEKGGPDLMGRKNGSARTLVAKSTRKSKLLAGRGDRRTAKIRRRNPSRGKA